MTRRAFIKRGALFVPAFGIAKASAQSLINPYRFAGAGYTAGAASFNGATNYLQFTSSGPTGLADGKVFTWSFWVKMGGGTDGQELFFFSHGQPFPNNRGLNCRRNTSNHVQFYGYNSSDTIIVNLETTSSLVAADGWTHVYCCFDLTDSSKSKIYFDGASQTLSTSTFTNDTIDIVGTNTQSGHTLMPTH
jgi:hypothetical protein